MLLAKDRTGTGKRIAALLSFLMLVPAIRKLMERRHEKPRRHFPSFGH